MSKSRALRPTWYTLVTAGLMALHGAANAAPTGSSAPSSEAEAKKSEAFRLFAEGDFAGGITAMRESHRLAPHPAALFNIAVGYDQWGDHCKESLATFEEFFSLCAGSCELLSVASRRHEKILSQCTGNTVLDSTPAGALLELDGEAIGTAPIERKLIVGTHELTASQPGYLSKTEKFVVAAGQTQRVRVELELESAPVAEAKPPTDALTHESARSGTNLRPWSYAAFGLGGAGIIMGIIFAAKTQGDLSDEEAARATPLPKAEIVSIQETATTDAVLANVGFGVGIVGAAAGLILLLASDDDPSELSLSPLFAPNVTGIAGRF